MARPVLDWSEYQRWRDQFANVLDPRFYTIEWLDGELWSGRFMFLSCKDAASVFAVKSYPTGALELHGMAAVGNLRSIVTDLIPQAEIIGRELGCIVAVIESRPAWSRVMKDFTVHQVHIRKDL